MTVVEDRVAVERVAVSSVLEEAWELVGEHVLSPRRFLDVVDANPGPGFFGEPKAASASRRGATSEDSSSALGGTPRYISAKTKFPSML